jgi:hypothetical protein
MNNQEREVITDIFRRLEQAANQPRDPDAERLIADQIRQQPYAPYAMAQALYVQEQALTNLHNQVQQLEAELERMQSQPQQSGGFLASLFGGGSREADRSRSMGGFSGEQPRMGGQGGPWSGQPSSWNGQPGPWGGGAPGGPGMMGGGAQPGAFGAPQRGGSGFLGTAMMTAAGVAGGMMLGNALSSAFGGSAGAGENSSKSLFGGDQASQANGAGDHSALSPFQNSGDGAGLQDAAYEPSEDLGGGFGGDAGDGDWA